MLSSNGNRVNLNSASERELTQLPRIGADKARRIVHYQAIRRGFRDWVDFAAAVGISEEDVEATQTQAWIGPFTDWPHTQADRPGSGHSPATQKVRCVRRMEILIPIVFYALLFVVIWLLRRAARADMDQWHGGRR